MRLSIKQPEMKEVIRQTQEQLRNNLADALENKKTDYFTDLKNLSETHVPREVQECLEKTVNEVNSLIFPLPSEVRVFADFNPYDNRFSVTLENETFKVRPNPVSFPKTEEFPHNIDLYVRETLNATKEYREFLRDIFQELILFSRSWMKNQFFELLKDIPLINKLYGIIPKQEKNILEDLYFVPVNSYGHATTHYLINPSAAKKAYGKLKKTASELGTDPIALLIDLARTPIPYDESLARRAEGKNESVRVCIDEAAMYQKKQKRYFKSEKAVMGNCVYAYEICDAGGDHRLFAEYPGHREDITDILTRKKSALRKIYLAFLEFEKKVRENEGNKRPHKATNIVSIHKGEQTRRSEKTVPSEFIDEIRFIAEKIRNFRLLVSQETSYIVKEINSLAKSKQNDKVTRRRISLLLPIFSFFINMPERPDEAERYREEQEDRFIEEIKRIMTERGLALTPQESERVTADIRTAIDSSSVLKTTREEEEPALTEQAETEPMTEVAKEEEWPDFLPPLPEPGGDYPLYPGYTDVYQFLKNSIWSKYLKHFNRNLDKDYLTRSELKERDLSLGNALWGQRVKLMRDYGVKPSDVVPGAKRGSKKGEARKPCKISSEEAEKITMEELKRMESLTRAKRRVLRKSRSEHQSTAS